MRKCGVSVSPFMRERAQEREASGSECDVDRRGKEGRKRSQERERMSETAKREIQEEEALRVRGCAGEEREPVRKEKRRATKTRGMRASERQDY